jgi:CMP-N-acetylneuraminic acid synthetase
MGKMMITALMPMKGHSERVENKNLRDFDGAPLYHAVLNSLLRSDSIEVVLINTDSEEIKKDVRTNFGERVIVIDRPENIRGDFVSMNDIIKYDLSQSSGDLFLQTHSTNPLLSTRTIDEAVQAYIATDEVYDSMFSVTRIQTRFFDVDGKPLNHNPSILKRTQDLVPMFEENSNFYIFTKGSFAAAGSRRIGIRPKLFEMNRIESIDIDEVEDFLLAEILYKNREALLK